MKVIIDDKIPYIEERWNRLRGALFSLARQRHRRGQGCRRTDYADTNHLHESLLKGSRVSFIATATIGMTILIPPTANVPASPGPTHQAVTPSRWSSTLLRSFCLWLNERVDAGW
jgi:hypothetical protein